MRLTILPLVWLLALVGGAARLCLSAELIQLNESNFARLVPQGKEPDAIYGDWVLRNEHIVAVIAAPLPTRNANMTVRNVGGMLIDLTLRGVNSDQLSCFYPAGGRYNFHDANLANVRADSQTHALNSQTRFEARRLEVTFTGSAVRGSQSTAKVTYILGDGDETLGYRVEVTNSSSTELDLPAQDSLRCDGASFAFGSEQDQRLFWAEDPYFGQAYGVLPDVGTLERGKENRPLLLTHAQYRSKVAVGKSQSWSGRILCSQGLPGVRALANALQTNQPIAYYQLELNAPDGAVANCPVEFRRQGQSLGSVYSDDEGWIRMRMEQGDYEVSIRPYARPAREHKITLGPNALAQSLTLESAARIEARVVDQSGQPIPAKIQLLGTSHNGVATETPNFGPDAATFAVRNLLYTANGQASHPLAAGTYSVIVSHGPEFDAVREQVEVKPGQVARLQVQLVRSVDTKGWISGEFHSHSTPSGDNTSSQLGRVLNLLAENLEFAPCTEHNRIESYEEELQLLRATKLMATCTGMELTGQPLPVNHQNGFPLRRVPRTQDGGGPVTDVDPVVQIKRLRMWDDYSDKVVQLNHPHLPQILGDRDLDGQPDEGFREMLEVMDIVEVHPLEKIFAPLSADLPPRERGFNPVFSWMQLLNLGYRAPGVVNTDAHYNWHGSGWLRNYIASSTDDPAKLTIEEMLRQIKAGHMTMTTAPFLQTEIRSQMGDTVIQTAPGDRLDLTKAVGAKSKLWIRVQCANWYDINRVQVFANGRPHPELNFTRASHGGYFGSSHVRFEAELELPKLEHDTYFIVATIGEGLTLGDVFGEQFGKTPPVAISNPIYVDVDGGTFKACGDDLGVPFMLPKGASTPGAN